MTLRAYFATLLGFVAVLAIFVGYGLPEGHSAVFNRAWAVHYPAALAGDNPVPRYLPDLWAGFGGYDFFFYAPLPFWGLPSVVIPFCQSCDPTLIFVMGAALLLCFSGLACFWFLRCFFEPSAAAFGATLYVIAPYHLLINWFERQAVGEFTAAAFLPIIALGIEKLRRDGSGGWILTLGVAGAGLSHLPTTLLAGHVFGVVCLVFLVMRQVDRLALFARFGWYGGLGLMISGFYWLPAIILLETVSADLLFDPYFEAWRWLFGASSALTGERIVSLVVLCFLTALPILAGAVVYARGALLVWIVLPVALAVIMNLGVSEPVWRTWIIAKVQFPWRMMVLVDLAFAAASATLVARMMRLRRGLIMGLVMMVAVIPYTIVVLAIENKEPEGALAVGWAAATEYLSPETAEVVRVRLGRDELTHFDLKGVITAFREMSDEFRTVSEDDQIMERGPRSFVVRAYPDMARIPLPVQYWALWNAETSAGRPLETGVNSQFGTLDILAPEGGFDGQPVTVRLPYHWSEQAGFAVSVIALLLLGASAVYPRFQKPQRQALP